MSDYQGKTEKEESSIYNMSKKELIDWISKLDLNVKLSPNSKEDEIRKAILDGFEYEEEFEYSLAAFEMEDEVEEENKGQVIKRNQKKSHSKRELSVGIKWDSNIKEHLNGVTEIVNLILTDVKQEYYLKTIKQGFTVYLKTQSKERPLFGFKRLRLNASGGEMNEIHGYFFFHALKGIDQVKEFCGEYIKEENLTEYSKNLIYMKECNLNDLDKVLASNNLLNVMLETITRKDVSAVQSRERMENQMREEGKLKKKKN